MLMWILNLIEDIFLWILPITLIYYILFFIKELLYTKASTVKLIKGIICLTITKMIIAAIIFMVVLTVLQLAIIWEEYELENVLNPLVEQFSYNLIIFIWSLIGVALIYLTWHLVYKRQIIPGEGNVKFRLKNIYTNFMEEQKNERR